MIKLSPNLIRNRTVLLRYDLDVPIENGKIVDDFRLKAGLKTLEMCLQYAASTVILGHIGRPQGKDDSLSVKPIVDWFEQVLKDIKLEEGALHVLENLRFEEGEDACDPQFAKELSSLGGFYINEAFAAHHPSASTTILPTLLPHAAGLNFAEEVAELTKVRNLPKRPLVAIIGGAKIEDKLPAIQALSKIANTVLVGGKLAAEIKTQELSGQIEILPKNVLIADLNQTKEDIAQSSLDEWEKYISEAKMIIWNGPTGRIENPENEKSRKLAQIIIDSGAETIVGGGDTTGYLSSLGLLNKFDFASTGGGAMLKFLVDGTLKTIEVLK